MAKKLRKNILLIVAVTCLYMTFHFLPYDLNPNSLLFKWRDYQESNYEEKICSRSVDTHGEDGKVLILPHRLTNYTHWTRNASRAEIFRKEVTERFGCINHCLVYNENVESDKMLFSLHQTAEELSHLSHRIVKQKSCAIVGSSDLLSSSRCGKEINSHDFVMRLQLPPIRQYKLDVGTKTNLTYINWTILRKLYALVTGTKTGGFRKGDEDLLKRLEFLNESILWYGLPLHGVIDDGNIQNTKFRRVVKVLRQKKFLFKVAFSMESMKVSSKRFWTWKFPSSGLGMVLVAMCLCEEVDVYGFYPFYHDAYCNKLKHHYYDDQQQFYAFSHHSWREEFEALKILHQQGVLRLVTGKCFEANREHKFNV